MRSDITDRSDVTRLVNVFYDRIRTDDLLGPIFDEVARVDWTTHLPKMYDFWESVLFQRATFRGNPPAVHRALARQTPMTGVEFGRWIALFHETVDHLFAGPMAEHAKSSASRIALALQYHIAAERGPASAHAGGGAREALDRRSATGRGAVE